MLRTINSKQIGVLLLTVFLLLSLAACGHTEPGKGTYVCVAAEAEGISLDPQELYPDGVTLELQSKGKGRLLVGEESGTLRWSLSGEDLTLKAITPLASGTLRDGRIRLALADRDVTLTLVRDDLVKSWYADQATAPVDTELWCGDWFGRWSVSNSEGLFVNTWYDCCAVIAPMDDGEHLIITLWDEDGSRSSPLGAAELSVGGTGIASSMNGSFWLDTVDKNEWRFDPHVNGYERMVVLRGHCQANGESFDYEICLRPWGQSWADVEKDDFNRLPFRYEWYQEQIRNGRPMPDSLPPAG